MHDPTRLRPSTESPRSRREHRVPPPASVSLTLAAVVPAIMFLVSYPALLPAVVFTVAVLLVTRRELTT